MPEGLNTVIGAGRLPVRCPEATSGGASQALILDPDVSVLDDSYRPSMQDQRALISNLKSERRGKTTIITAHRLWR